MVKKKKR